MRRRAAHQPSRESLGGALGIPELTPPIRRQTIRVIVALGEMYLKIQESAENYLETILMISERKPQVRSIDIVNELDYSKPSVSIAMKNLRENGYIHMDKDGFITLTDAGRNIAETMYERHKLLSRWLINLGVNEKTAVQDACRMEHVISAESFEAIKRHADRHLESESEHMLVSGSEHS